MIQLEGKYSNAIVYSDRIEDLATTQILELLNHPVSKGSHPRFMPDIHAGAGCVIGTTMRLTDKVVPNLIGVDIGCGVRSIMFNTDSELTDEHWEKFDRAVREKVPSGMGKMHECARCHNEDLVDVCDELAIDKDHVMRSIGTLGGGNHFIEVGQSTTNPLRYALTVHTGSRGFGYKIATYWQNIAIEYCELKKKYKTSRALAFLEGEDMQNYLRHMRVAQGYALYNNTQIGNLLLNEFPDRFNTSVVTSIHNYIGSDNIIRKGAVSAKDGESLVIPFNMRDGIVVGLGKGNRDWNNSAPHGAGRVLARGEARRTLSMDDYTASMNGIWSSSVCQDTIDEAPMAYKDSAVIEAAIGETMDIISRYVPVYSFKAGK